MTDYLVKEAQRIKSIEDNTSQKFKFVHQDVTDVDEFKHGIFENRIDINPFGIPVYLTLQDNDGAGVFVRNNSKIINDAADEFDVDPNLVRAVIYTEMSRGFYDQYNLVGSPSVLPGNLKKNWEKLIPGSDINNKNDNVRLTAKLISEIGKRLDEPFPEDIYSLYNSMAHDKTYQNGKTKNTPYFLKQVLKARAWEFDTWTLPNRLDVDDGNPEGHGFPAGTLVDRQEGTIKPGEQPGSDGVRLNRGKVFAKRPDEHTKNDGFSRGKGDLIVPKPGGQPASDEPGLDHSNLLETVPDGQADPIASLAAIDELDIFQMAEDVFSSLTLDDWATIPDDYDPFARLHPTHDGGFFEMGSHQRQASP